MTINAYLSRRDLMAAAATLVAAVPARSVLADEQTAPLAKGDTGARIVRGAVFESRSGARERQAGDHELLERDAGLRRNLAHRGLIETAAAEEIESGVEYAGAGLLGFSCGANWVEVRIHGLTSF